MNTLERISRWYVASRSSVAYATRRVLPALRPRPAWLACGAGAAFTTAAWQAHTIAGLVTLGVVLLAAEWRVSR